MTIIDRRYSVAEGTAVKAPCRVATTANITLSGLQTIDGVTVVADDRVLVKNQTTVSQNGIYTASSGNWTRTRDFDGAYDVVTGTRVLVTAGSTQAGNEYYISTTGTITIDTTSIAFTQMPVAATLTAAAAAAAASAAAAAGSEAALGNQVRQYDTRAQAAAATIPTGVQAIRITTYATGYPIDYATYVPGSSSGTLAFQEAAGNWWQLDTNVAQMSVRWFGAKGDGVADDAAAIQAAINAARSSSINVFFPSGTYKVGTSITVTGAVSLLGLSRYSVAITWTNPTFDLFAVASESQVNFKNLTFNGPASASAGAIISLTGGGTHNLNSTFRDCTFNRGFSHIVTTSSASWTVDNCDFFEFVQYGVYVSDTYSPDSGDSSIVNCMFSTLTNTATAIHQVSSGGLKIIGNKILGGSVGYNLNAVSGGTSTVDLLIVGNSIENQVNNGIQLQRLSGANTFGDVVIVGNQLSNMPTGIVCDANAGWLSRMVISSNTISLAEGDGACISLGAPSNFLIDGNHLYGQSGTTVGISIGVSATNGQIGVNAYNNLTTPISNGSSSVLVTKRTQVGSSVATTNAAAGAVFNGSVAITFPLPFSTVPKVVCNVTSGGISAWAASTTTTGFTAFVWAPGNATAIPFEWIASADA